MAGIILTILKIIGIIILVIIGCILLLAALILFYPVNYKVNAETDSEALKASVYIHWLFHIFRFRLSYDSGDKLVYNLKILFFQILPEKEKSDKKKKSGNTKRKNKKTSENANEMEKDKHTEEVNETEEVTYSEEKELMEQGSQEDPNRKMEDVEKTSENSRNPQNKESKEPAHQTSSNEDTASKQDFKPKKEQIPKISDLFQTIKKKITNLKFTFQKICDKIKEIFSGYEKFREFILSEETKETLTFLNTQRKYLFRHLKPDKSDIYLHFGTEDPAVTGEILAVLSLVYAFYPWNLNVVPDFEESCFEGKIEIKGKLQSYAFLILIWRLYGNKNIKKIIKTVTQ